jgi:uncharacterized protein (TIGR02453 family)
MTFTPATLRFFRELAKHNAKPWFEAHRAEYERDVRDPMRALIEQMDVRLARFAPEITGDPKRSMFRIYRDVRFSKDKSPYKTHASCWFSHRDADPRVGGDAESGGAGFYVHIQPRASFVGAGIWMPPRPLLNRLRDAIAERPAAFERVVKLPAFVRRYGGLDDEAMLKRMPRGFADDHPAGALAQVPVIHRRPAHVGPAGDERPAARLAGIGFHPATAPGAVAERRARTPDRDT